MRSYITRGTRHMPDKPKCIIVTGRPGAGKSTLSKELAKLLYMPVISREISGCTITVTARADVIMRGSRSRIRPASMFLVSRDDSLHERMADDVALGKLNNCYAFSVLQRAMRFEQAGIFVRR